MPRLAWREPNHVVDDAFKQIFHFPRIIGSFPFSEQFKLSPWSLLIGISWMIFAGYYYGKFVYSLIISTPTYTLKIFDTLLILTEAIFNFISFVWLFKNLAQLQTLKKILNRTELIIRLNGIDWFYRPKWFILNIKFFLFLILTLLSAFLKAVDIIQFYEFALTYLFIMPSTVSILIQIESLFSLLRSVISLIKYIPDSSALVKTHESLLNAIEIINVCYGPQLLFIFAQNGLFFVRIIYSMCTDDFHFDIVASFLYNILLLTQIFFPPQHMMAEVKKINKLLYKRLQANPNDEMLQFHLLAKKEVVFTACGFFNFENSIMCTMVQTGTTYLVILLQYNQASQIR